MTTPDRLEFWPDYAGVLLHAAGQPVPLDALPLSADLVERSTEWVRGYDDSRLPFGDSPDDAWFSEGRAIFAAIHDELASAGIALDDWEGIWSAEASGGISDGD